jgi:hypothetical protein
MRHFVTKIRTKSGRQVVRGLISAVFFLAFITLLNAAPSKNSASSAGHTDAAAAKPEASEAAARKEAETDAPQAASAEAAEQDADADGDNDPDMPTFRHGNVKIQMDESTYLKLRAEHIMRLRGLSDPSKVDPHARGNAIRTLEQQETRQMQEMKSRMGIPDTGPPPSGTTWTEIGPAPIPNGQTSPIFDPAGEFPVSGRVTAIAVHPTNSNILYVGAAQGGVYRSLDGGATWTPLMDGALSLAVGAVAIAPSQPSTIYVGTGEANFSGDSFFGVGVYRIDNADTAPVLVGPLNKNGFGADVMTGRAISQILVHPTDPNTIFVSTATGIGGVSGSAFNILPPVGLYRSTNAAGPAGAVTFTKLTVATAGGGNRSVTDIAMDPSNPDRMVAAVFGNPAVGDGGYYLSTNATAATPTFSQRLVLFARTMKFAINKVGSVVTVMAGSGDIVTNTTTGRLRRSIDGGATWSAPLSAANFYCGGQCAYDAPVAMAPGNANIIFTGGPGNPRILKKSTDGAASFTNVGTMLHADTHAIVFDPSNTNTMYTGDDGGIFKSTDGGNTWTSLNNSTFSATQFTSLSLHPHDREFMIGGTQDNGTEFRHPDASWLRADFGDGGFALIDQNATNNTNVTMYHTYFNQRNNLIGFVRTLTAPCATEGNWAFLGPFVSDNTPVCDFSPNTIFNGMTLGDSVLFYAPMALGPGNPNTVYYGSDHLYRSSDRGETTAVVSQSPIITGGGTGANLNVPISAVGISPQNDNVRIVGMQNGRIFATTTGSTTLTDVTGPIPGCYIARAKIDPNNVNTAYVTLSCFGLPAGQHVWKTTNLSNPTPTWTASGSGIPDVPVNGLAIDPRDSNFLYAGTDIGVYQSGDGGATWNPYGTGLPRVAVFDIAIQSRYRVLRVATHGRGIWEIGITDPIGPPTIDKAFGADHIPLNGTTSLTFTLSNPNSGTPLTGIGFTDTLPTGLALSTPSGLTGVCGGGAITAPDGGTTVSLSGATLAPGAVCSFSVNVNGTAAGPQNNTTTPVTCNEVGGGETASATVTVGLAPTITKTFGAATIPLNGTTTSLSFTISNPNTDITLSGISFTDNLPTAAPGTLVVATPGNLTTTCSGTATAADGSSSVSLTGASLTAGTSCTLSVTVQGTKAGSVNNRVIVSDTTTGTGNASIAPITIPPSDTATAVTSSVNPSTFGQSVTFTATVTNITGSSTGAPTGTVQFVVDGLNFGTPVTLTATGSNSSAATSLATATLSAAGSPHTVTAKYANADGNFNNSTGSLSQSVTPATTSTAVVSSLNPSVFGQSITFTATVTNTSTSPAPTGAVQFAIDGVNFGPPVPVTLGGGNTSTATSTATSTLPSGSHSVTANYVNADGNFSSSSGSLAGGQTVKGSTTTAVTSSQGTITLGDTVTFTATVTTTSGTPGGLVTFFDGSTPLGAGTLALVSGNDQATFSTSLLSAAGSPHSITATYQGDANFGSSTSSPVSETVNPRTSTTGVVLNPTTVVAGQASAATVTVTDSGSVPPGTADTFATTGAPATGRTGFTSTLYADGLVLVAGGTDAGNNVLQSAAIYTVSGAGFAAADHLNAARTGAVAVLLPNGKVLVAGGSSDGTANGALNTAELFDPGAGTFTPTTHTMTAARFGTTATLLNTGKVLIAGGQNSGGVLNGAELYDPAADTFTATGNLNTARTGAAATLLGGGKVLIAGGSSDGTANGALNGAEVFDPAGNGGAGIFASVAGANPTLSAGRWQPEAALLLSGKVLIAGGQNSGGALASADLYDPVADSFTASSQQMAQARANGSAVSLPSGMVLLAGGTTSQAVDLYDTDSDRFDATGSLQQSDNGAVSTLLNNGDVLVVGLTSGGSPASDAELYSPSFNPLGTVGLSSSEATDTLGAACVLTPSTSTASTCASTVTPANVATSPHMITGTYAADAVHSGSSNTAALSVAKADTTTAIVSSANPSVFGQPVTFTATVAPVAPGAGTPTGTVDFFDGTTQIGSGTLSGGVAAISTSTLTVGSHTINASYNGDPNFNTSTGSLLQQVNKADTSTTVASNHNPSVFGQSVTFTATVAAVAPGTGSPSGTVSFFDGTTLLGTRALGGGHAMLITSALITGSHTINATYNGDGDFNTSTGSLTQDVNKDNSSTTVISSQNPSVFGQAVTFTASVSATPPGTGTPSGTVDFFDGGVQIGTGTLASGTATVTLSTLPAGNHAITATYNGDGDFNTSTGALIGTPQVVTAADTATAVTSSQNPSVFGLSVTFTATVTDSSAGSTSAPTGAVQFVVDGVNFGAPVALTGASANSSSAASQATATLSVTGSPHTVTANYVNGDGNFSNSTGSLTGGQTVTAAATMTTVQSSQNPSAFGQSVIFTATVTDSSGGSTAAPTGSVQFVVDGVNFGSPVSLTGVSANSSSAASQATATLSVSGSPHTVTANYVNADGNFSNSTGSLSDGQQITAATTTTAVQSSQTASVFGQSVTFTATVTDSSAGSTAAPTGAVQFVVDGVNFGSPVTLTGASSNSSTATSQATATLSVTGSPHSVTANYVNGDGNFSNSTGSLTGGQTVTAAATMTTVQSSLNPSTFGQSVTFTATVTDSSGGSTAAPTGAVQFVVDGVNFGSPVVLSGVSANSSSATSQATLTLSVTGSPHSVTANYVNADGNFSNSDASLSGGQLVTAASTTTAVVSSLNPAAFGQSVTFSATVTNTSTSSAPSGAVQFVVDGVNFGSPVPVTPGGGNTGTATSQATSTLPATGSPHAVTANYVNADGNFTNSTTSLSSGETITAATTTTAVQSSQNSSVFGQSVTFTATVTDSFAGSAAAPTGAVQFVVDGVNFGTPVTLAGASSNSSTATSQATATLSIAGSPHSVTANYVNADGNFINSTGSLSGGQRVTAASSTTVVVSDHNPSNFGQMVTFTATVAAVPPGAGTPTGNVTFKDGSTTLGSGTLSGGVATFATSSLTAGNHAITAVYGGDADFNGSTSPALTQAVTGADVSVILTHAPDPANLGGKLTFTAVVHNSGPDSANVSLSETFTGRVSVVSATSTAGTCSGTGSVTCNLGNLTNGASATVTIVVTPLPTTRTVTASANVTLDVPDTSPGNNTATEPARVRFKPFHF